MDTKTSKNLQQAGKYVRLGKLTLALEQYLKIHELEPEDTTILNNIGDLYVRLDDKENAMFWYTQLAESFSAREMFANAVATYRKILKIVPKNQEAMMQLALLCEQQGQKTNAKNFYQMLAQQKMDLGDHNEASSLLQKACNLEPECSQSFLKLAQHLELQGKSEEAVRCYLQSANLLANQNRTAEAVTAIENVLRIRPKNREIIKALFLFLEKVGMTSRAIEYLQSITTVEDSDFKLTMCELLIVAGNVESALKILKESVRENTALYAPAVKLLKLLISEGKLDSALDLMESIIDISIQMQDEDNMREILDNLARLDGENIRIWKTLTTIMIRMNDKLHIETYLKKLVTLQLQYGNVREARESLNKLVVYGQADYYLDLLNLLNEASLSSESDINVLKERVIKSFENGHLDKGDNNTGTTMALGVTEENLGTEWTSEVEEEFVLDSTDF